MNIKAKLTSRKFLVALTGIVSGIALIFGGATEEGATAVITSIVAYLAAEGLVDLAAVKKADEDIYTE